MIVKLLTEHHLEFLSLTGGCGGSSESTLVKMSNCWKSQSTALKFMPFSSAVHPSTTLLGYLVLVICNSTSFHLFLFKLCIMIVHILKMYTLLFCAHFMDIFLIFEGCRTLTFFRPKILR